MVGTGRGCPASELNSSELLLLTNHNAKDAGSVIADIVTASARSVARRQGGMDLTVHNRQYVRPRKRAYVPLWAGSAAVSGAEFYLIDRCCDVRTDIARSAAVAMIVVAAALRYSVGSMPPTSPSRAPTR